MKTFSRIGVVLILGLAIITGCNKKEAGHTKGESPAPPANKSDDHDHVTGPHDGPLAEWGGGEYHAEFTVNHEAQEATVYILGADAKKPVAIAAATIRLSINNPRFQVELKAAPQDGDPAGKSSRFVGKHEHFGKEQMFEGTISGTMNGKPYAGEFKEKEHAGGHGKSAAPDPREVAVFLKPGGAYTEADIAANGRVVPSVKYKGFKASHDIKPKAGDRLCPVTLTKSNDKLTWVVGGKTYEFCCPPCLEEFVQLAKDSPGELKNPEDYVKKK